MKPDRAVLVGDDWKHFLDGKEVTEAEYETRYPPPAPCQPGDNIGGMHPKGWPIISNALAVHARQIPAAKKFALEQGVNIEFTPEGRAILNSPEHRRAYAKSRGCMDLDAYY